MTRRLVSVFVGLVCFVLFLWLCVDFAALTGGGRCSRSLIVAGVLQRLPLKTRWWCIPQGASIFRRIACFVFFCFLCFVFFCRRRRNAFFAPNCCSLAPEARWLCSCPAVCKRNASSCYCVLCFVIVLCVFCVLCSVFCVLTELCLMFDVQCFVLLLCVVYAESWRCSARCLRWKGGSSRARRLA